ncbi:VOC family protein [Acidobacteria bacterium AH-259-A15]|nr:VOC family protein [Acidobacteria bacterium AH-259-A15]
MKIQHISAVTLAVQDMARSVDFYKKLGLEPLYGGEHASFTSFRAGEGFINLILTGSEAGRWWGRVILRVEEVDSLYSTLKQSGLEPGPPRDGEWGERFFHLKDPDGHELSFAQLLRQP